MKNRTLTLAALFLSAGLSAVAAPKPASKHAEKVATAVQYKAHCGMVYSAADAKKYHYVCPMDHKSLTKITAAVAKPAHHAPKKA